MTSYSKCLRKSDLRAAYSILRDGCALVRFADTDEKMELGKADFERLFMPYRLDMPQGLRAQLDVMPGWYEWLLGLKRKRGAA